MLQVLQIKYQIFNHYDLELVADRPYIIMSNHASHFDIPLIYESFRNEVLGMIAKRELFRIPIFGPALKRGFVVAIDRKNKFQAKRDLEIAKEKMSSGVRFWIAPEGTRSTTGELGVFKKGGFRIAFAVKATIIPVAIIGSNKVLPAKTLDFSFGEKVEVHIGKPIDVADCDEKDIQVVMERVKNEIARFL